MIEINLLPEALRRKEAARIAMPEIPIKKTLFMAGGAIVAIQIILLMAAIYVKLELVSLNRQTQVLKEQSKEVIRQKAEMTGIHNRLKEIRAFTEKKIRWTAVLNELTQSITKGIWLRNLYVSEEISAAAGKDRKSASKKAVEKKTDKPVTLEKFLVLEGAAVGVGQETAFIGKFLKELKDNPLFIQMFSEIKPSNINQKRIGDHEIFEFTIRCQFKKDKS